ncbi:MAG TPA: NADH-quinone oxidoreductase subunit M [Dissulfurispiraceae bacterium]|nr:NADH-quinone oxidoreductase subunit M [Dissulfurispiraceae bacterium]
MIFDPFYNAAGVPLLSLLMLIPALGAALLGFRMSARAAQLLAFGATLLTALLSMPLYLLFNKAGSQMQFVERISWVAAWNLEYSVGIDGISLPLVFLTVLISPICVLASWQGITTRIRGYYACLLLMESIMLGIFVSLNLILLFFFWEAMLVPMYLLIGMWGSERGRAAAMKFLLFTLGGSIFMLVGIVAIYLLGGRTFDIGALSNAGLSHGAQLWLFIAFFLGFAVKVPVVPFHGWQPDAYAEAPTAATIIMAAVLAKMGTYGFIRILFPFFPHAAWTLLEPMMVLAVATVVYGAYCALAQRDLKRLIAYSSLSHMGFILLGIATLTKAGIDGSIIQMVSHGVITGGLFLWIASLEGRLKTRMVGDFGGLSRAVPVSATIFTLLGLAATGFPGLSAFVGEFLILSGVFQGHYIIGGVAVFGVVLGVAYMCWAYYRLILFRPAVPYPNGFGDLGLREAICFVPLLIVIVVVGVQPGILLEFMRTSVDHLIGVIQASAMASISAGVIR